MFKLPGAPELAPKIAEVIFAREKQFPGIEASNLGGWHSDDDLLDWPELQFADLKDTFRSAVSQMISVVTGENKFEAQLNLVAWANVNRKGSANAPHIHPEFHWSGVLYVKTPDLSNDPVKKAGYIEFQDPRGPISMLRAPGPANLMSVPPEEGMLILFPSWLYHWVNGFSVDDSRISIAFNARIQKYRKVA